MRGNCIASKVIKDYLSKKMPYHSSFSLFNLFPFLLLSTDQTGMKFLGDMLGPFLKDLATVKDPIEIDPV